MEIDYGEIEEILRQITGESVGFGELVEDATNGGSLLSLQHWIKTLGTVFLEQLQCNGQAMLQLLLLLVSSAVLAAITRAFRNRQISDMGFYILFLLLMVMLMGTFGNCYVMTEELIYDLTDFMKVLMPAYLAAAAAGAYKTTAVVYYEGFLMLMYFLQKLVAYVLLPGIRAYVLLSMLSFLGKDEMFQKGRESLKKLILWALKAMIGVSAGLQMIQGMLSPAIDEMKHTAVSKGISSLGNIGNVAQNVTDVILGSAELLKNGIGVVAALLLISICLVPAAKIACYCIFYQFMAAVAEPVSDGRIVGVLSQMGEGLGLLMKLMFTVCAMFLLTIAIVCVTTGGIV